MRFGFVTCVRLGLVCLEEIYAIGGEVDAIFTLNDDIARKKSGRVYLDEFADRHGTPLQKIANINDAAAIEAIHKADLDWLFIIGWSQIAGATVLAIPRLGCIGMHPTLLPEGRGRASIPWAILKGLKETGVTMFTLDEDVDSGPIIKQERVPLEWSETATTLYEKILAAHRRLIADTWELLISGIPPLRSQDEDLATYWPGRSPADGRIDPTMTVAEVDRLVRSVTHPYPGAFVEGSNGDRLTIWAGSPDTVPPAGEPQIRLALSDGNYWINAWSAVPAN